MTKVADPWGGSYLMESLTNELVKGAMQIIDEVRRPLSLCGCSAAREHGVDLCESIVCLASFLCAVLLW